MILIQPVPDANWWGRGDHVETDTASKHDNHFLIELEHQLTKKNEPKHRPDTGCSLNIVFFFKILRVFWTLPFLLQRWFYLPRVRTNTDTKGKQKKNRVQNILKSLEKTQYLMIIMYIPLRKKPLSLFIYNPNDLQKYSIKNCAIVKYKPSWLQISSI